MLENPIVYKNIQKMLQYWYFLAKDVNYQKNKVKFSQKRFLKDYCENCGDNKQLKLIQLKEISEIFRNYRIFVAGKTNND